MGIDTQKSFAELAANGQLCQMESITPPAAKCRRITPNYGTGGR